MLPLADEGRTDEEITAALHTKRSTANGGDIARRGASRSRALGAAPGLALSPLDVHSEAVLLVLGHSPTRTEGRTASSMQPLADRLVQLAGGGSFAETRSAPQAQKQRAGGLAAPTPLRARGGC